MKILKNVLALSLLLILLFHPIPVYANHSWGNYHWARTSNPIRIPLGDSVAPQWDQFLITSANHWNRSAYLDTPIVSWSTSGIQCRPKSGQVQVCSAAYGETGWLGLAQLWSTGGHITAATVKMNDTYFNQSRFNTTAWRQSIMCQEIGHAFGLDHQDEDFSNTPLKTCMDYSIDPTQNQMPNMHDFYQLQSIYLHMDSARTAAETSVASDTSIAENSNFNNPSEWGKQVSGSTSLAVSSDRVVTYERDFGGGKKLHTVAIHAAN